MSTKKRIPSTPAPSRSRARGLTLIEVLVTMVLMGIGLVGLAGLQMRGMQVNQGATFRSQAAFLAEDMADRMRVDVATAKAGTYDNNWNSTMTATAPAAVAPLISDWLYRLGNLPSGCAKVDTTQYPAVTITVTWDDSRAITGANANTAALVTGACLNTAAQTGNGSYVLVTELAAN
jgi:type IV pilus assembly protein PilV